MWRARYHSAGVEKTLADPAAARPELPQVLPSSELVAHLLAPGLAPTFRHDVLTHGELAGSAIIAARATA
jgi:hypothetical protein